MTEGELVCLLTQISRLIKLNCFSWQTLLLPLKCTCSEKTGFCVYENYKKQLETLLL